MFGKISLIFLLSATSCQICFADVGFESVLKPRIFEDTINASVECVRETLTEGIPDLGLPSFDPLKFDDVTLDFNQWNLSGLTGYLTLSGQCDDIVNFRMTKIQGDLVLIPPTYTVNFSLDYDNITCEGSYDTNATILGYNIFGKGNIVSSVKQLEAGGHVKAVIENGQVDLQELDAPITIEEYVFLITGLFNDEELSQQLSETISKGAPDFINNHPEIFSKYIGPLLVVLFNMLVNDEIGVGIIKEMVQKCIIDILFPPF